MNTNTLYASSIPGYFALDSEDGPLLLLGTRLMLSLPHSIYLMGDVQGEESLGEKLYIFVPEGSEITRYGIVLRAGMQVILLSREEQ